MKVEAVIFDWAGTTIDYGCFAPVNVFLNVFSDIGIEITLAEARESMGILKKDHLIKILKIPRISAAYKKIYNRSFNKHDVNRIYIQLEHKLFKSLLHYVKPIEGVKETLTWLRNNKIKIGSTTSYTESMMEVISPLAKARGYAPDCYATSDQVSCGRPYPYMIYENLDLLEVKDIYRVIKIGDTVSDIEEGVNAHAWSVGVLEGGNELGLSKEEYESLSVKKQIFLRK